MKHKYQFVDKNDNSTVRPAIGIDSFRKLRQLGYTYVDKTKLISELVEDTFSEVTLITRPRRFGKTLAMSMLDEFFKIDKESEEIFKGLRSQKIQIYVQTG